MPKSRAVKNDERGGQSPKKAPSIKASAKAPKPKAKLGKKRAY